EAHLYNLTAFDDSGARKKESVLASVGIVLEFDDGELSIQDASRILRQEDIRHIIYSSFNRSELRPNKFHVVVPFSRPANTAGEHMAVYRYAIMLFGRHGYTEESLGLDPSCANPTQFFYLPRTNKQHPEWSYYSDFGGDLCPKPAA